MHTYETLFITPPTLAAEDEQAVVEQLVQIVSDGGGSFHAKDRMGRRRLAYPIEKHDDGIYVRFLYDSSKEVPKELERRMRLSDKILRGMTVRLEPDWAVAAKEQAIKDAERRAEMAVEAERRAVEAAEAAVKAEAEAAEEAAKAAEEAAKTAAEAPAEAEAVADAPAEAEAAAETPAEAEVKPTEAPAAESADDVKVEEKSDG